MRCFENQFDVKYYDLESVSLLREEGFSDECWGNDSCPRFEKRVGGPQLKINVLVEAKNVDSREFFGDPQFTAIVEKLYPIGCVEETEVFHSESIHDLLNAVKKFCPTVDFAAS